jgi:IstB-like ATP binding protein
VLLRKPGASAGSEALDQARKDRDRRRPERRIRAAGFPRQKWLTDFEYFRQPQHPTGAGEQPRHLRVDPQRRTAVSDRRLRHGQVAPVDRTGNGRGDGRIRLFQVSTEREEGNSVAIASNESFGGRPKTCTDPRLCAAIVDRLTFNGTIIETGTGSYPLAHTKARMRANASA